MMSSSSSSSTLCSYSSDSNPCSYSDTLQPEDILKEREDTVPEPENSLLQHDEVLPQPEDYIMPGDNRSVGRDVHIFDASDRSTSIGGLILTMGVTNANLYTMIEIFIFFDGEYILRNESDITIEKDDSLLQPGNYYIDSPRKSLFNSSFL